jgi:putative nucleotidyltransferase with HDIG domain
MLKGVGMDSERIPDRTSRTFDVVAWGAVGLSTLLVTGLAIAGLAGAVTVQPFEMATAAAWLVASCGFAVIRQLRTDAASRQRADAYDVAFASELAARERLSFARHTAALMALPQEEGLAAVLEESLGRFGAEAAALVDEELTMTVAESVDRSAAEDAVLREARQTIQAGRAIADSPDADSNTLTIPLRIRGQLKDVIVLWRRGGPFTADDLDGLSLVARIVELSMENRALLDEVRQRLSGTLQMMIGLVEQRLPEYRAHSQRVAEYAVAAGAAMNMPEDEIEDLRTAGLLHDVGMLTVPEAILSTPRRLEPRELEALREHPQHGAELVRVATFSQRVQDAIRSHHERVDGTGYPDGLKDGDIPVASRILNVCDAFVALISDRPHRPRVSEDEAIVILRASAGTHYDPEVVEHFVLARAAMIPDGAPESTGVLRL